MALRALLKCFKEDFDDRDGSEAHVGSVSGFLEEDFLVLSDETSVVLSFLKLLVGEDSSHKLDVSWHTNHLVFFQSKTKLLDGFLSVFAVDN